MADLIKAVYYPKLNVTQFIADDGRHLIRSGGTMTWQINNPGNLSSPLNKHGEPNPKKTKNFVGFAPRGKHRFFIFPDYETGRAEKKASLRRKYNEKSLRGMLEIYLDKNDPRNDLEVYLAFLVKQTGFPESTVIKTLSDEQLATLMDAIERQEGCHADKETRKETWVNVTRIQATNGTRPLADEEIVVEVEGRKITIKSDIVGQFPPIVHGSNPIVVKHKTPSGELKTVGELPAGEGKKLNLLSKFASWLGFSRPDNKPVVKNDNRESFTYTVQPGDNLGKIANKFNITVERLKEDNKLTKDLIYPGQKLGIGCCVSSITAPQAPKKSQSASSPKKTITTRSKQGEGKPLSLILMEEGVAPWMKYALEEVKRHKGADESVIEKDINYHKEVDDGQTSMSSASWCAAFASWCLMKAGYPIDNPREYIHSRGAKGRAWGFVELRGQRTKAGQPEAEVPWVDNPLFSEIAEPVYGAIVVTAYKKKYRQHVGFAYSKTSRGGGELCLLGGNQTDTIHFSPFHPKDHVMRYFLPSCYKRPLDPAKDELPVMNPWDLDKNFGILGKGQTSNEVKTS